MVSKNGGNKSQSSDGNYQDSVVVSLSEEADDHAAAQQGEDEQNELTPSAMTSILPAIDKVCCSSSQVCGFLCGLIIK